ncbi:MAG TPA: sugar phosphate isomerase/epimerase family protein [Bryobacteraceae bacterium]|nr:sugar phosphate isomerase/epimerase family protein [Bryobacteraceae bacterium]
MLNRRELLAGFGSAVALTRAEEPAQSRTHPMICLFSKHLQKLHYTELGGVLQHLGFEGCDLTVRKGGHVRPELAPVDLVRAIESIRGAGVEVPMITTDLVSAADPHAVNVLGLAGRQYMGVPFFKPGYYRYGDAAPEARLAQVRRDFAGLVSLGRANGIAAGFHNHSGDYVGQSAWETREVLGELDPRWAGYYFDPCHATIEGGLGGWQVALRLALPRVKMIAMKDFSWQKVGGKWIPRQCPMGEGMVDWPTVFSALAKAKFTGPLSLHIEYGPADELAAISRDLAWVKKQVAAAWGA